MTHHHFDLATAEKTYRDGFAAMIAPMRARASAESDPAKRDDVLRGLEWQEKFFELQLKGLLLCIEADNTGLSSDQIAFLLGTSLGATMASFAASKPDAYFIVLGCLKETTDRIMGRLDNGGDWTTGVFRVKPMQAGHS